MQHGLVGDCEAAEGAWYNPSAVEADYEAGNTKICGVRPSGKSTISAEHLARINNGCTAARARAAPTAEVDVCYGCRKNAKYLKE